MRWDQATWDQAAWRSSKLPWLGRGKRVQAVQASDAAFVKVRGPHLHAVATLPERSRLQSKRERIKCACPANQVFTKGGKG